MTDFEYFTDLLDMGVDYRSVYRATRRGGLALRNLYDEIIEESNEVMPSVADRVRHRLDDYERTVADPTQAPDIAEVDLIHDIKEIVS
jgi:hypothetical protein